MSYLYATLAVIGYVYAIFKAGKLVGNEQYIEGWCALVYFGIMLLATTIHQKEDHRPYTRYNPPPPPPPRKGND